MMVFRCVDAIATNQSPIPIFMRKGDSRTGQLIQNARISTLLNVRPNSYETAAQFRYRMSSIGLLSRRGIFIELVGNPVNPDSIHLIPPGMCEPIPDPQTFVKGYRVRAADMSETILKPEQVIWIKLKPHPTDPYMQMTPLVTAGIAAETDYFARLFNRNFLQNDGRPGLLVSVRGQMNPVDAEELKRRFGGGYNTAGSTTVIEAEGIDVADMGATPRDAQWQEATRASKEDIMIAFGVPESVLGNASGRTFDNADAEYELFWTHTMVPHCEAIAGGLDVFTGKNDDDTVMAFDYRSIDVLQRQERRKREAAINEYAEGAITWNEMRDKIGEEVWTNAVIANVIVTPSGFAFAKDPNTQAEIMKQPNVLEIQQGNAGMPGAGVGQGVGQSISAIARAGASLGAREAQRSLSNQLSARALQLAGKAAVKGNVETKSEQIIDAQVVHPYMEMRNALEAKLDGLMTGWDSRQEKVLCERLDHAKVRKGTRHWEYDSPEEKSAATRALDPYYVVEVDRWSRDMRDDFQKVLRPVLLKEAGRVARDMESMGLLDVLTNEGVTGNTAGRTAAERVLGSKTAVGHKVDSILNQVLDVVENSTRNQSNRIAKKIEQLDNEGKSLDEMKRQIKRMVGTRSDWRKSLSGHVTTSAIEGVKNEVYAVGGKHITKTWNTEEDERVRDSHVFVEGVSKKANQLFEVGGSMMRFPGDPLAPVEEVANCRCWLDYSL
jgi:HK97 family phage portal protein